MNLNLGSLGDGQDCSINPCTWWDGVWVSDGCLAWLQQCNPTDPRVIAMKSGFIAGAAAGTGQAISAGVAPVGSAVGDVAGSTLSALFGGLFVNPDGTTNWTVVSVVSLAGAGLLAVLLKK